MLTNDELQAIRARADGEFYIPCKACNMIGPLDVSPDLARDAWNALPRALTWTTEPPQVEGWYWVRSLCPGSKVPSPATVFLYAAGMDLRSGFETQYAGPIPAPKEPNP